MSSNEAVFYAIPEDCVDIQDVAEQLSIPYGTVRHLYRSAMMNLMGLVAAEGQDGLGGEFGDVDKLAAKHNEYVERNRAVKRMKAQRLRDQKKEMSK